MIPVGTLCIIVAEPQSCNPPELSGRFCTVMRLRQGQSLMAKCNIEVPGYKYSVVVWEWDALKPIVPPPPDPTQVKRYKELCA